MSSKDNNLDNDERNNTYFINMKINKIKYEYCNIKINFIINSISVRFFPKHKKLKKTESKK